MCRQVVFTISFTDGKPYTPQQTFVSLKSAASGALVVLAAKAGKSNPNEYSLSFTADSIASQIGTQVTPRGKGGGVGCTRLLMGDECACLPVMCDGGRNAGWRT